MKRRPSVVWSQTPQGWRAQRAIVPPRAAKRARSERVPRPPSFRFAAAGAEDVARDAFDELRDLNELRGVVELGAELVGVASKKFGAAPVALLAAYLLTRKKKR